MAVDVRGKAEDERALDRKIDAVGWGIFFLWVGVALLANLSWGAGLVGVGVITIGGQVWRRYAGVKVERFWVFIGGLFAVAGIWNLLDVRVDLVPLLFIAAGVYILASMRRPRRASASGTGADVPAHPRV